MKTFCVTKKFDALGRVVIPKEMREHYGFYEKPLLGLFPKKKECFLFSIVRVNKTVEVLTILCYN